MKTRRSKWYWAAVTAAAVAAGGLLLCSCTLTTGPDGQLSGRVAPEAIPVILEILADK